MMKIDESAFKKVDLLGERINLVIKKICRLIDIVYSENTCSSNIDFEFFDIKGSILLYGIPGVGKTTIAYNCLKYALEKYGIESYTFETSEIIVADLGQTTRNLHNELEEFQNQKEGILFLDEIDRLCINRENFNEISELKRMLIELMQFLDLMNLSSRKMVIGCTNMIEQLDKALKRRFSIREEIKVPTIEEKAEFVKLCLSKAGYGFYRKDNEVMGLETYQTMDMIKKDFRDAIIEGNLEKLKNKFEKED